jgi:hypothetical protein
MKQPPRHFALLPLLGACAAVDPAVTREGPELPVPVFAAGDPRVGQAGFVGETLRLHREDDGVRCTLMVFAVGDTLTLGAMVRGAFRGEVRWRVGGRTLRVPFDAGAPAKDAEVAVAGAPGPLVAHGAQFRGTSWTNIEVPLAEWLADGTPVQLEFAPEAGSPRVLPDAGFHYVARLAPK